MWTLNIMRCINTGGVGTVRIAFLRCARMLIALDPSINETGYAFLRACGCDNGYVATTKPGAGIVSRKCQHCGGVGSVVIASGVIKTRAKSTQPEKLYQLVCEVTRLCATHDPSRAVIEYPEGFTYARMGAKGKNARALIVNGFAVGHLAGHLHGLGIEVQLVGATEWKGKMGKGVACSLAGVDNHNEADAIMLGRWACGR